MPVIGTPITPPSETDVSACGLKEIKITEVYGQPIAGKLKAVQTEQGQALSILFYFRDDEGNVTDMSDCVTQVKVRIREAMMFGDAIEVDGTITDLVNGQCTFTIPATATECAGISICDVAGLDDDDAPKVINKFFLVVNRGQWSAESPSKGPPTIEEVRLYLRDNAPEDNYLLDEYEFDMAEIAWSLVRPIEQFNNMQPPIDQQFNTSNFPYRYPWMEGAIANLFFIAAAHYRRNHLSYSAAGVSVDDKNKEKDYLQAAMLHKQNWETFAKAKKVEINMEHGFGVVQSGYSFYNYPYY